MTNHPATIPTQLAPESPTAKALRERYQNALDTAFTDYFHNSKQDLFECLKRAAIRNLQ